MCSQVCEGKVEDGLQMRGSMADSRFTPISDSLSRSSHIVCHIKGELYIHGGLVTSQTLAGPEMHILKLSNVDGEGPHYRSIPALAKDETGPVPKARAGHAAVAVSEGPYAGKIVMFGGYEHPGVKTPLDESGRVWVFDPETLHWTNLDAAGTQFPSPRFEHGAVAFKGTIIIHGGRIGDVDASVGTDTWQFDLAARTWTLLPSLSDSTKPASDSIISATPPLFATHSDKLYLLTGSPDKLSTTLHILDLPSLTIPGQPTNPSDSTSPASQSSWASFAIPSNPLTPSPGLRSGASTHAISTGVGRIYLLICFGASSIHSTTTSSPTPSSDTATTSPETYTSDIWTLQLPTATHTPASLKDVARSTLPQTRPHTLEYHPISIIPKEENPPSTSTAKWLTNARESVLTSAGGVGAGIKSGASGVGGWVKEKAAIVASAGKDVGAAAGVGADAEARAARVTKEETEREDAAAVGAGPGPVLEDSEGLAAVEPEPVSPVIGKENKDIATHDFVEPSLGAQGDAMPSQPLQPGTTSDAAARVVEGKAHPGPRAWCGSAVLATPYVGVGVGEGPVRLALWGGVNAKGAREGDGWVVELRV